MDRSVIELQFQCRICGVRTPALEVQALPERGPDFRGLLEPLRAWGWHIEPAARGGGRNLVCSSCVIAPQDRQWAVLDRFPILMGVDQ